MPLWSCRSCIGLGILVSALMHGLALSLWLKGRPPYLASRTQAAMELDLDMFAAPGANGVLAALAEPAAPPVPAEPELVTEPVAAPTEPLSPTEATLAQEPIHEPPPSPNAEPEPRHQPVPVVSAEDASPPEAPVPPKFEKTKSQPKPTSTPKKEKMSKLEKKPEPRTKIAPTIAKPPAKPPNAPITNPRDPARDHSGPAAAGSALADEKNSSAKRANMEGIYLSELHRAIKRHQRYPEASRRQGTEGIATIGFILQGDGRIVRVQVVQSSDDRELDRAAIDAINRLGRFKPIPLEIGRSSWSLRISIRFDLR